jgi:ribonuclease III
MTIQSPSNAKLYAHLGYVFKDKALLTQALSHRSRNGENNERLEFLGDAVLNAVVAEGLYHRYPTQSEGVLTRFRSALVREESLATLARSWHLGQYLLLGIGERKSGGSRRSSILADALEALVAAIYLEAGYAVIRECILQWMDGPMNALEGRELLKDSKTQLQEWAQARQEERPQYRLIKQSGSDHAPVFEVEILMSSYSAIATGSSLRIAEQKAAKLLWDKLHDSL